MLATFWAVTGNRGQESLDLMIPKTMQRFSVSRCVVSTTASLVAALAIVGCGPATGKLSGKVTYGDKIVKGGMVTFVVEGKGTVSGSISEEGTYSVTDVPAGQAKVCVDTSTMNPAAFKPVMKYSAPKDQKPPDGLSSSGPDRTELERRYVKIPDRYASMDKSGLSTTVTGGAQTYDIKLDP